MAMKTASSPSGISMKTAAPPPATRPGHGYTGALVNNPAWVASSAPLVFNQVAGDALKFDGVNGYVMATNTNDLNSYPFTATAWFRTTNTANFVQGIVSKYADASGNGWTLVVQNNHLRGFYYRNNSFSDVAIDATSARPRSPMARGITPR